MKRRVGPGLLILAVMFGAGAAKALASPRLAEKENVECIDCHRKPGSQRLTNKGKYYEALRTFEGYDRLTEKFGDCSHCHKRKAGSKRLTKEGERVRAIVKDMKGLFEWLKEGHTGSPE